MNFNRPDNDFAQRRRGSLVPGDLVTLVDPFKGEFVDLERGTPGEVVHATPTRVNVRVNGTGLVVAGLHPSLWAKCPGPVCGRPFSRGYDDITRCELRAKHSGECWSTRGVLDASRGWDPRCRAENPEGGRCDLDVLHEGDHQNKPFVTVTSKYDGPGLPDLTGEPLTLEQVEAGIKALEKGGTLTLKNGSVIRHR